LFQGILERVDVVTTSIKEDIAQKLELASGVKERLFGQLAEKYTEFRERLGLESSEEKLRTEAEIAHYERLAGIETDMERVLEASCLIDRPFLEVALITDTEAPERLFGDKEWLGYLKARVFLDSMGPGELTPEILMRVHEKLAEDVNPQIAGAYREVDVVGGDYKNLGAPTKYTIDQVEAIKSIPGLSFRQYGDDPVEGYIVYPPHQSIGGLLTEICEEYNRALKDDHDPYLVATRFQRGLVSTHPFNDYNGRLSRLLMNWSLRGEGLPPAFLENPDLDLTTSQESWLLQVQKGSADYARVEREPKRKLRESALTCRPMFLV